MSHSTRDPFDFSRWPAGAMTLFPGDRLRIQFQAFRPDLQPGNAYEGHVVDVQPGGMFRFIRDGDPPAALLFHVTDDFVRFTKLTDWRAIAESVREHRLAQCTHEPGDPDCNCGDD